MEIKCLHFETLPHSLVGGPSCADARLSPALRLYATATETATAGLCCCSLSGSVECELALRLLSLLETEAEGGLVCVACSRIALAGRQPHHTAAAAADSSSWLCVRSRVLLSSRCGWRLQLAVSESTHRLMTRGVLADFCCLLALETP